MRLNGTMHVNRPVASAVRGLRGNPGAVATVVAGLAGISVVSMLIGRVLPSTTAAAWLYLPLVLWVTIRWGLGAGVTIAVVVDFLLLTFVAPPIGRPVAADNATYARLALSSAGMIIAVLTAAEINRRRRLAERQGRIEAETLADISRRISASLDLDEVLQTAAESARRLAQADVVVIALADAKRGLRVVATSGDRTTELQQLVIPPGAGLSAEVLASGRPIQIHIDDSAGTVAPSVRAALAMEGITSTLALPIHHGSDVAGVFWVHARRHRVFTDLEVELLDRLSAQAGVAIANAQSHADERLARAEVEGLLTVTESLGIQASPEKVLRALVEQAAKLLHVDRATYAILRNDKVVIPSVWQNGEWVDDEREVPSGGIAKHVWDTGRPYGTNEIETDPYANAEVVRAQQIRSQLTVPLLGPDLERLGLVSVNNSRRAEGFTDRDERLLVGICETGAEILLRARDVAARVEAEREAARRKQEVEALLTAADRLNTAVDADEVLRGVVEVATELFDARGVCIATDESGQVLIRYYLHDGEWTLTDVPVSRERSLSGWVIEHGRQYVSDDLSREQDFEWTYVRRPNSALSTPILGREGRILGALSIFDRRNGQYFTDGDLRLAEGIAHHAAVALERARSTTKLRQMTVAFEEAAKFSEQVIASASQGIVVFDRELRYLVFNPFMEQLSGVPVRDVLGKSALDVFPHLREQHVDELLYRALRGETVATRDVPYYVPQTGRAGWSVSTYAPHRDAQGQIVGVIGTVNEVTARKELDAQLERRAFFDALTGLPNRARFMEGLEEAVERLRGQSKALAVLFLDLDGLKVVNDSLGHAVGDTVLRAAGERLLTCLQPENIVARFGGDEFAVLLADVASLEETLQAAETILQSLHHPFAAADHHTMAISASIGVTFHDAPGTALTAEDLIREADTALYRAKAAGKAQAAVFDPSMSRQAMERMELESDLHQTSSGSELRVFYQPLIQLATRELAGVEALMRWQHPRRGLLEPMDFIPLAEETGLILPMGAWVLEQACRQTAEWRASGQFMPEFSISVNLSARQFEQPDLVELVDRVLRTSGLEPSALVLEITETAVIRDIHAAIATLTALKQIGVRVAIDDFGTGYSSLSNLQRLPVDVLKIDRSFMTDLQPDSPTAAILEAAISMAHALGIEVTGEGIETRTQLDILTALGCDCGQGYLLGWPSPASALTPQPPAVTAPPG